jgi:hypothetical protein
MFEGRIEPIGDNKEGEQPVLRELRWPELLARLEATRDFRKGRSIAEDGANSGEAGEAGFGSFASRHDEISSNGGAGEAATQEQAAGDVSKRVKSVSENQQSVNHALSSDSKTNVVSNGHDANIRGEK